MGPTVRFKCARLLTALPVNPSSARIGQNSSLPLDSDLCDKEDKDQPINDRIPVLSARMCCCIMSAWCVVRQVDPSGVASFQQRFCAFKTGHSCSSQTGQDDARGE